MERTMAFFSSGLMALEHCWSRCIILEDIYIKKEEGISTGNKLGWLLIDSPSYSTMDSIFSLYAIAQKYLSK